MGLPLISNAAAGFFDYSTNVGFKNDYYLTGSWLVEIEPKFDVPNMKLLVLSTAAAAFAAATVFDVVFSYAGCFSFT